MDVKKEIKEIIVSKLKNQEKIEGFTYDTPLLSLGIDSILALSILVEIEEKFDIEINDDDLNMDRIRNVKNFAELIESYL
jgi:acyl carrier protein